MVMLAEPVFRCVDAIRNEGGGLPHVVMTTPQGRPFNQDMAKELAAKDWLIILCGRYEGFADRVREALQPDEISIGDFVVSGGELPAMLLIDALVRLLPGALNDPRSALEESFSTGLLEGPQFTRPEVFEGVPVPPVLLSGHHARIARWRRDQSLRVTRERRPDLIVRARSEGRLDATDEQALATITDATSRHKTS